MVQGFEGKEVKKKTHLFYKYIYKNTNTLVLAKEPRTRLDPNIIAKESKGASKAKSARQETSKGTWMPPHHGGKLEERDDIDIIL